MTDFIFSSLANGSTNVFNNASDVLIFGTANAADIAITARAAGGVSFTLGGKTVNFTGVTLGSFAANNISIAGSTAQIGDGTVSTDLDDLANTFAGGTGNDLFLGLGGNDSLTGSAGNDFANGNTGSDNLAGGEGNDFLRGGADNDTLAGDAGNDTLFGDNGNDNITAGAGNDLVNGNAGNDTIVGTSGINTLNGGQGNDTITAGSGGDLVNGDLGNDSIGGGAGIDTLNGGAGNDSITAGAGGSTINGNAGNDTLTDAAAVDTIRGGADGDLLIQTADGVADIFYGDNGNDTFTAVNGAVGTDTILGGAGDDSITLSLADAALTAVGGEGVDTFTIATGATASHTMSGGAGADTFNIFLDSTSNQNEDFSITDFVGGTDVLNITVTTMEAASFAGQTALAAALITSSGLYFEDNDDNTVGDENNLTVTTSSIGTINVTDSGDSSTSLIAFNNTSAAATLTGGAGADLIIALDGNESVVAGAGADYISVGNGNNTISSGDGADTIVTGSGNDSIDAGTDATGDSITAGAGNDTVTIADDAATVVDGGTGTNTINIVGAASETFVFNNDSIEGFQTINLSGTGAITFTLTDLSTAGTDIADGTTVTISASAVTSGTLTVADSDTAVKLNITGTSGADNIVVDTTDGYAHTISGGDGADTITGAALGDSLVGGADNDTITGNEGVDNLTLGTGSDVVVLNYSNVGTEADVIADFNGSGTDEFELDLDALEAAGTSGVNASASDFVALSTGTSVADTDAFVVQELTGTAAAAANATLFAIVGTTFANTAAVETALEAGGTHAITGMNAGVAQFDNFVVVYSDGTHSYVAVATFAANPGTAISANDLSIVNVAQLTGNTAITASEFVAGNFDWIA